MSHRFTPREVAEAAEQGEGFCLECGARQDFLEKRLVLGLCHECEEHEVVSAELVERVQAILDLDADD
jgi:hypothetical protein